MHDNNFNSNYYYYYVLTMWILQRFKETLIPAYRLGRHCDILLFDGILSLNYLNLLISKWIEQNILSRQVSWHHLTHLIEGKAGKIPYGKYKGNNPETEVTVNE